MCTVSDCATPTGPRLTYRLRKTRTSRPTRLRFVGAFGVPAHHFRMFWRDRGRNEFAEGERFLGMSLADENSEPFNHDIPGMPEGQRTIVAWVDDTINQIRIDPDDKPCMFKLLEIEL